MSGRMRDIYGRLVDVTWVYNPQVRSVLQSLPPRARVCDLGAGGQRLAPGIVTLDGFRAENTDIVADLHDLPLRDESFDCVITTGTLEHVRRPPRVLQEIFRVLRPGGLLYVEVPFIQGYHADPTDFRRWTLSGIEVECLDAGFTRLRSGTHMGPSSAITWVLRQYALCFVRRRWPERLVFALASILLRPLKYLDAVLPTREPFQAISSGVYFLGSRPDAPVAPGAGLARRTQTREVAPAGSAPVAPPPAGGR
jgi:SAM-dependent methyltransferase